MNMRIAMVAAFTAALLVPAAAGIVPKLKSGMWRETETTNFVLPGQDNSASKLNHAFAQLNKMTAASRICIDAALQDKLSVIGGPPPEGNCTRSHVSKTGDGIAVDFTCRKLPVRIETHGDVASALTAIIDVGTDAAGRTEITRQFRYLGQCTGDLTPGDVLIPGFPKMRMERAYAPAIK